MPLVVFCAAIVTMNSERIVNKSLKLGISGCTAVPRAVENGSLHAVDRKANCKCVAAVHSAASTGHCLPGPSRFLDSSGAAKEHSSNDIYFRGAALTNTWKDKRLSTVPSKNRPAAGRSDLLSQNSEVRSVHGLRLCPSSRILMPTCRTAEGHAEREVMAAAALTSLSTTNLQALSQNTGAVPELTSGIDMEELSGSYSSSTSENWCWDFSDQSVPSTPSPPLCADYSKGFKLLSQGDVVSEESESTHFLFEDPIPRKRKNSMKVMFKCLWKNCGTVLSSSSGIRRHVRTLHLGRTGDSEDSEGEEDFYYSEMEVNMDTLSEGLSCLTPTSPTSNALPISSCPPPSQHAYGSPREELGQTSLLSQSAPSILSHIKTDHTYQSPRAESCSFNVAEVRQPLQHISSIQPPAPVPTVKPSTGSRKSRGEAKKCRKVYGLEKKDLWCTACRWKKACQRFTD